MTAPGKKLATAILRECGRRPTEAPALAERLFALVQDELHRLAAAYLRRERSGHTLQPTALVNEAYLRLVDDAEVDWRGRTHFLAVGARVMRRLLIDHARARNRAKRGGNHPRATLVEGEVAGPFSDLGPAELVTLDRALERLAELDPRQGRVVELRFFAGMTVDEVAAVLGVSPRTVKGDWRHARAWLRRELEASPA